MASCRNGCTGGQIYEVVMTLLPLFGGCVLTCSCCRSVRKGRSVLASLVWRIHISATLQPFTLYRLFVLAFPSLHSTFSYVSNMEIYSKCDILEGFRTSLAYLSDLSIVTTFVTAGLAVDD